MLAKLLGIVLIIIGGSIALEVLFPLIGLGIDLVFLLIKSAIAILLIAVGYRLFNRETE